MKVLIVGYGRAGKRHATIARNMGFSVESYDPYNSDATHKALPDKTYDIAVICSPPDKHLEHIKLFSGRAGRILCEKPLCDFGQLREARNINQHYTFSVAYNYYFNPDLQPYFKKRTYSNISLFSAQYRDEIPPWGLVLDHLSHDIFIIRQITSYPLNMLTTNFISPTSIHVSSARFSQIGIIEVVVPNPQFKRTCFVIIDGKYVEITANYRMFTNMWEEFLKKDFLQEEALEVQYILEGLK